MHTPDACTIHTTAQPVVPAELMKMAHSHAHAPVNSTIYTKMTIELKVRQRKLPAVLL